ncbi:MAG: undecaprenyldiphospho-muramoylpentapeptide beta-N-acetylglucosaminyltransferase [Rhodospirillales bacterium]|nr:undecaprenyldiphospho-muramoylpentapeptide beta-N-acetylglucosaminyltransferase [Rhodospirillales bacterium]
MSAAPLIVLAAGGTGGHVFPAEALAGVLQARGYRLALITDRRGAGYGGVLGTVETHRLPVSGMGGGLAGRLRGGLTLGVSVFTALRLLGRLAPAAVVGFGGYPSLPTVFAAAQRGVRTAIHEQNAILGRANRFLAPRVDAIATSFAETRFAGPAGQGRVHLTGNPVRAAAIAERARPYTPPVQGGRLRVLVTGGSQGAAVFGRVVPAAVAALPPALRPRLDIVQQCRPDDLESVREAYRAASVWCELSAFFDDLPARIAGAHLVIARAGASTTAELAVIGRPALLVPYPHATDDHQTANARALVCAGGAWLVPNTEFTPPTLAARLAALLTDPEPLIHAATAARSLGRPDAAERLANLVAGLAPADDATRANREAAE